MKGKATMKIEFLAGTSIKEAIAEAKTKAKDLDLAYVKFEFNGVRLSIGRGADVDEASKDYERCTQNDNYICRP